MHLTTFVLMDDQLLWQNQPELHRLKCTSNGVTPWSVG
jgi:hypothetical protein